MKNIIKDVKLATSLTAVLMIILGIMLLIRPEAALFGVCRFVGVILLMIGAILIGMFGFKLGVNVGGGLSVVFCVMGAILVAIGLFIAIRPDAVIGFVGIWFAVLLILHAMNGIREMMNLKAYNDPKWHYMLISVIFNILVAVLIILHPFGLAAFVMKIAGVGLLISGIMGIGTNVRVVHMGYTWKKNQETDGMYGKVIDVEPDELRKADDK